MSYSPNSLKGGYVGDDIGEYYKVCFPGDTRSLDYSSYASSLNGPPGGIPNPITSYTSSIVHIYSLYVPLSKLLVSPLITPIVVPYRIPYVTPFKEFRL